MAVPDRHALLAQCRRSLEARRLEYLRELENLQQASAAETKSSAGDKYETAREMIAQARNLIGHNLSETMAGLETLDRMAMAPLHDRIGFGSLVKTNLGWYLVGLSLGEVEIGGTVVRMVSLASPLGRALRGRALRGRAVGESIPWRGAAIDILAIPF